MSLLSRGRGDAVMVRCSDDPAGRRARARPQGRLPTPLRRGAQGRKHPRSRRVSSLFPQKQHGAGCHIRPRACSSCQGGNRRDPARAARRDFRAPAPKLQTGIFFRNAPQPSGSPPEDIAGCLPVLFAVGGYEVADAGIANLKGTFADIALALAKHGMGILQPAIMQKTGDGNVK